MPALVTLYNIWRGNGSGLFVQPGHHRTQHDGAIRVQDYIELRKDVMKIENTASMFGFIHQPIDHKPSVTASCCISSY